MQWYLDMSDRRLLQVDEILSLPPALRPGVLLFLLLLFPPDLAHIVHALDLGLALALRKPAASCLLRSLNPLLTHIVIVSVLICGLGCLVLLVLVPLAVDIAAGKVM